MKRIKYILASMVIGALALQSCSEDKMDDINKNKNNPEFMESKYIITEVMVSTGFSVTGSDLAFYASVYTELLGGGHNQMYKAQERMGEPILSTTYNNSWNSIYRNLRGLTTIEKKCSEGGEEAGNYHTLGIAQILKAYNLGVLTDLFGDVPYSEALNPILNPQAKLDKQEDIYKAIFKLLDDAIVNLDKESEFDALGKQDIIYGGSDDSVGFWKSAAYGLKARYLMHLSAVSPDYQAVIDNVNESFRGVNEDFYFRNANVVYPFYAFRAARSGLFSSKTYYDIMQGLDSNDPRLEDYFVKKGGQVVLLDHSQQTLESQDTYSLSGLSIGGMNDANAVYLMSYHELLFLKAEAQARIGDPAAVSTLQEAVEAGLNKHQYYTYGSYNRVIPTDLTGPALLKRIAQEKYLSAFEVESIEMYNDIRRWKAMGEELIELKHKDPAKFPKRFAYGNSDVSNNPHVRAAYGDGNYVYTENVWWAGGTR
ncbi:SusD/RagB family nutrient-binding outer membrane lipoprotein [Myroides sp. DW712]|uniref:SusD/RagB family nutrient-binding outer membrane lipoprotein n=1 Tax=Myroides sp. DW712 TaxID=3389800 RepID=UPI00397DCC09